MSSLWLGDELVWENPPDLGHFAVKLRKQIAEDEIVDRMDKRAEMDRVWRTQP